MNPVKQLEQYGQSVWLDYLSRGFIAQGKFKKLIEEDGLKGVTSNPTIFEKAIGHSDEYDEEIQRLLRSGDKDVKSMFRTLAVHDVQSAADVLRSVYNATHRADGFASYEVSPDLADNTDATIKEARELWKLLARLNVMIKVPATQAGLPAIRQLTAEGVNINITLLFSRKVYGQVAEAFIAGLEDAPADRDLGSISSVASFFVSRIDTKIDGWIEQRLKNATAEDRSQLESLCGKVAITNAKLAYRQYKEIFSGPRWQALAKRGARPQRLLWASTGTKNKAYSDVLYAETLIGSNTVNTLPLETIEAFRDHGTAAPTLEKDVDEAETVLASLERAGISLDRATDELVEEGVEKFVESATKLDAALESKIEKFSTESQSHAAAGH